jgi:hypothetical protein
MNAARRERFDERHSSSDALHMIQECLHEFPEASWACSVTRKLGKTRRTLSVRGYTPSVRGHTLPTMT